MREADHTYTRPVVHDDTSMPALIATYFDGSDLDRKAQAARLSTVDEKGWPHASLLSAGDMLAIPPDRIRFAAFAESVTAANLARDRRLTMSMVFDEKMYELRFDVRALQQDPARAVPLALFEAALISARMHAAPYAALTSGVTFALHEPAAVLPRWLRQLEALRHAS